MTDDFTFSTQEARFAALVAEARTWRRVAAMLGQQSREHWLYELAEAFEAQAVRQAKEMAP